MKRVLILGAGGPAGINFARCLKGHYHTIGLDTSPYAIHFSCCDENYIGKKEEIIDKLKPHLIIAQPDPEVMWLGEQKKYKTFMPKLSTIKLCSSKKKTLDKLSKASLPSVITQIATSENAWTLLKKYHVIWIRANTGNAGRLHFKTDSIAEAEDYIDKHYKENLVVSPYIEGFNVGVDVIFHKGVCVKWFCRHRISYSLKEVDNESGGQSQITKVVKWSRYINMAKRAIQAVDSKPHGVFGVDFKGKYITEINAGRFLTCSLVASYAMKYNLPLFFVKLGLENKIIDLGKYPNNKILLRSVDHEPVVA